MTRANINRYVDLYKRKSYEDKLGNLYSGYSRPSSKKLSIWASIENTMCKFNGYGLTLLTASCSFFTCAFVYRNADNVLTLRIFTPLETVDVPLN